MVVGGKEGGFYDAIKYFLHSVAFNLPLYDSYLKIDLWYVTNSTSVGVAPRLHVATCRIKYIIILKPAVFWPFLFSFLEMGLT